jgi:shikimate dehydrogenase
LTVSWLSVADRPPDGHVGAAPAPDRASAPPSALVIIGQPVAHSLSPIFQNAALDQIGSVVRYGRQELAPEQVPAFLAACASERVAGNITLPHKELAMGCVQWTTAVARRVGAVNTFWTEGGTLVGHNTDVAGAAAALRALIGSTPAVWSELPVVMFGAGGSAAATLIALQDAGARAITIVARTPSRAAALLERLEIDARVVAGHEAAGALQDARFVINATPVGVRDDAWPVEIGLLPPRAAVFDLVYRRGETPWVRACRDAGHRAEDGLRMLVEQGAAAFECWFGVPAPRDAMWDALEIRPVAHPDPA